MAPMTDPVQWFAAITLIIQPPPGVAASTGSRAAAHRRSVVPHASVWCIPGADTAEPCRRDSMKCPFCDFPDSRVIDSRLSREGDVIRRRRECEQCKKRFTTYERVEETLPAIIKKDGSRTSYDRLKLVAGLKKACEKRPVSIEAIEQTASRIEQKLLEMGEKEVPSSVIGEAVMDALHQLDQVAYVRFASVYRDFKDAEEFMREIEDLLRPARIAPRKKRPTRKL